LAIVLSLSTLAAGCSTTTPTATQGKPLETQFSSAEQTIVIDGSSTVYPLTDEIAKEFQFERQDAPQITVAFSGTGGGFRKFCAGETDVNNASRPISTEEMEACKSAGVQYFELPVAYDALTVVVHPDNTWAQNLTVEELKQIWEPAAAGTVTRWNQVRSDFPDQPLNLYGAGQDSGTFDYFTEAIVGEPGESRSDYTDSEDDTVLVQGVINDPNALGYFGYAYFEENQAALRAVAIDSGNGPVMPSREAVRQAQYQPLARPLFIYVSAESLENKPGLREFVEYYLANAQFLSDEVGYVSLPDAAYTIVQEHLTNNKVGTVFEGESQTNLAIEDLLKQEAAF
jgi:phosphate transport system substrate-binding protein